MANLTIERAKTRGRHHIIIHGTPKSAETRALMRQFHEGVNKVEKKWRAVVAARAKKARKTKR